MKLVHYPEEILLKPTNKVSSFSDEKLHYLVSKMYKIMKNNNGIGLAANQVGSDKSLFIIGIPFVEMTLERIFINPTLYLSGEKISFEEGCLSFPNIKVEVPRSEICNIFYQDMDGNMKEETFVGLPSIVIQHEFDHLQGKTFIDHLPDLTKQEILDKLKSK